MGVTAEIPQTLTAAGGFLPPRMRALFVAGSQRRGDWLAAAVASDSASDVQLDEAHGMAQGVARLRDEAFDAVLISHEPPELDALELAEAIRAGSGEDQAVLILGDPGEQEMAAFCYESGADGYLCVHSATTRALLWTVAKAVEFRRLVAENRRLRHAQQHRHELEQEEAHRLLSHQRTLIRAAARATGEDARQLVGGGLADAIDAVMDLPQRLVDHYRELLRAHVVMGSGNLAGEMKRLVDLLVSVGVAAPEAMQLHVCVVEEMLRGLGNRSGRHVMNRADMLILEVMIRLADGYRQRHHDLAHPARQRLLPGF